MRSFITLAFIAAVASASLVPDTISTETDIITATITSCAPSVTECTAGNKPTPPAEATTTYTSEEGTDTTSEVVATSTPPAVTGGAPYTPSSNGTVPAVPTSTSAAAETPSVPAEVSTVSEAQPSSYSLVTYTTCVPSTWVSTVPIVPPTTSAAGFPATTVASTGFATGTGVAPGPTTSPITPFPGAGNTVSASFIGAGAMAIAAFFL